MVEALGECIEKTFQFFLSFSLATNPVIDRIRLLSFQFFLSFRQDI